MFATFKGMKSEDIDKEVKKLIEDVDLVEKTDYLSSIRWVEKKIECGYYFYWRLQIDIYTSARRYIWTMLKIINLKRIVILTTHFMDEADFLGDRIGIMGEGKLICCGFLKFSEN